MTEFAKRIEHSANERLANEMKPGIMKINKINKTKEIHSCRIQFAEINSNQSMNSN